MILTDKKETDIIKADTVLIKFIKSNKDNFYLCSE